MNRSFRTVSALMRQVWLIEESYAQAHEALINAYLSGQLKDVEADTPKHPTGYFLSHATTLSSSARSRVALSGSSSQLIRNEIESSADIPENSVFVLDMRGPIMKEGSCFAYGTEDYVQVLRAAYAHPSVIGCVGLVDSPGGQLSGTPTLYDVIRDPIKPFVSVINEGLMASAAYWLACGSDFIYATQQTDQVGSIGVYVSLRDASKAMAAAGYKTITVYSSRSEEKNKPVRDALAGNTDLLQAEMDKAADLFRAAVEQGRGERLKPAAKGGIDVFKGGLFYASQAIELGLIDGFGDLSTAVAKVYELAQARQNSPNAAKSGVLVAETPAPQTPDSLAPLPAPQVSQTEEVIPPAPAGATNSNPQNPDTDMFGDKHKKLSALSGLEASSISDEQLNEINANLDEMNIKGARVISAAYLQEADQAIANLATTNAALTTANASVSTLTSQLEEANKKVAEYGSQPGVIPTKSEKVEEKTAGAETDEVISETDQMLRSLKAQIA